MSDQNETTNAPTGAPSETPVTTEQVVREKKPSLLARMKQFYVEKPITFALSVIGASAILFVLGGLLSDSSVFSMPTGPMVP